MKMLPIALLAATLTLPVYAKPPGGGMDPERQLDMMTERLSLTDTQVTQVQAILEATQTERDALREQMQALRDSTDTQIKAILTDDQVATLESMQQRHQRGSRHAETAADDSTVEAE